MKKLSFLLIVISLNSSLLAQQNVFDNADTENKQNVFEYDNSNVFNNNPSMEEAIESSKIGADGPGSPEPVSIEMYLPILFVFALLGIVGISVFNSRKQNLKL